MKTEAEVRERMVALEQQAEHHRAQLNATLGALEMLSWVLARPSTDALAEGGVPPSAAIGEEDEGEEAPAVGAFVDGGLDVEGGTTEVVTTNPEAEGPSVAEVSAS